MSWIPVEERLPERGDYYYTQDANGVMQTLWFGVCRHTFSRTHTDPVPWNEPIVAWVEHPQEPYVKPRRFVVDKHDHYGVFLVKDTGVKDYFTSYPATNIPTREAAQKIADIYEEAYRGE